MLPQFFPGSLRSIVNGAMALILVGGVTFLMLRDVPRESPPEPAHRSEPEPQQRAVVLYRVGERNYRLEDLPVEFSGPLYEIRMMAHEQQVLVLEQAMIDSYLAQRAEESGLAPKAIKAQLLASEMPTEADIQAFYSENRTLDTPPLAQIREEVRQHLLQERWQQRKMRLLSELLVSKQVSLLVEAPARPEP